MTSNDLVLVLLLSPVVIVMAWDVAHWIRVRLTKFDRSDLFPEWTNYWDPETESFTAKEYVSAPPGKERKQRWYDFL